MGCSGDSSRSPAALGLPKEELDIICAGINHQTWYISVKHKGVQYADQLLEPFEKNEELMKSEKVRIDMIRRFGYYSTESNGHLSEYLPWYRKRLDEIDLWRDTEVGIERRDRRLHEVLREPAQLVHRGVPEADGSARRSRMGRSIAGASTARTSSRRWRRGACYRGHFNVPNGGLITNLPADCIIEAPGYVDYNGFSMPVVGDLPLGCAAVCNCHGLGAAPGDGGGRVRGRHAAAPGDADGPAGRRGVQPAGGVADGGRDAGGGGGVAAAIREGDGGREAAAGIGTRRANMSERVAEVLQGFVDRKALAGVGDGGGG